MAKKYTMVRSYHNGKPCEDNRLNSLFTAGWEFVRASEFIPSLEESHMIHYGYIEYILCKEVEDGNVECGDNESNR